MRNIDTKYSKNWYILVCKVNFVKKTAERLTKFGIENYLPYTKELRNWHDRKKWIEVPAFGPYLFVRMFEFERNLVFQFPGVQHFLFWDGKIHTLKDREIERIKCLFVNQVDVSVYKGDFTTGDILEVTNGLFRGFRGELIQKRGNKYMKISFVEMGYSVLLNVTECQLKKV